MNNLVIVTSFVAFASVLSVTAPVAQAGPLHHAAATMERSPRTKREIYPEIMDDQPMSQEKVTEDQSQQVCVVGDLVYEAEEPVPAEQPCLKCKCQPPGVHCETTRCEKKPGCRAIHKPNTCCPEYQCECDYEGRVYANGERLEQKPGTECKVCYCRGGEVQCAEVSCYIRNDCEGRHVPGKCCPKYDHCPPKEPSNVFFANELNDTHISSNKQTIKVLDTPEQELEEEHQEITIHEIIPDIKEIPITNSPKREINGVVHKQLIVEEEVTHIDDHRGDGNQNNDLHEADAESDGSEVAEVYEHPPSVLRIGDKLLFLKKDGELVPEKGASTPSTVITIIGAEGLQRGGVDIEENVDNHEVKLEFEKNKTLDEIPEEDNEEDIQSVAESTYILSLVKRPVSSTSTSISTTETVTDFGEEFNATESGFDELDVGNFTDLSGFTDDTTTDVTEGLDSNATSSSSSEGDLLSVTDDLKSTSNDGAEASTVAAPASTTANVALIHEKEEVAESNPEYPPIPDVMTQQVEESEPQTPQADPTATVAQGKILPEVFELQQPHGRNSSPESGLNTAWLKKTLLNPAATLPDSILTSVAESDASTAAPATSASTSESEDSEPTATTTELVPSATTFAATVSAASVRSKETMESMEEQADADSGEGVTQQHDHASVLNDESNASIEDVGALSTSVSAEAGTAELVEMLPGYENMTAESVEATAAPEIKRPDDVEMIDVDLMRGHSSDEEAKNATHEGTLPGEQTSHEHAKGKKLIGKRESNEDESIFEELNREIGLDAGTIVEEESPDTSDDEAKQIFKELVDEATSNTTPKPVNLQGTATPQTREQHQQAVALARIGDALAKLQLRDSKKSGGVDTNVLGILRDFFTAQYRAYN